MTASAINQQLQGFTVLLNMNFRANDNASTYTLRLDLGESEAVGSRAIALEFEDVAQLSVSKFGGGLTQLMRLMVKDVRDRQWDRVAYEVSDVEREAIFFTCKDVKLVSQLEVEVG